ncbi:MAG: exosortase-associated EpsI family protein [Planctomycetes bacterium]|nr:exosortase-associated EpsI family protein [Planctomycetota bacterium]
MALLPQSSSEGHAAVAPRLVTSPFLVAVVLLGAAAALAGPVAGWLHIKQAKLSLPLKAPLAALREEVLAPYRVWKRHVLDPAIVEALGTDLYLSWTLEDRSVARDDPLRVASLLITYYSGGNNLVPHTPDVCYLGSGYAPSEPHENTAMRISIPGSESGEVPVRVCTFGRTAIFGSDKVSVIYTFQCNGAFLVNARRVRARLNNPANTYAFHSKVEVSFPRATRAKSLEGAKKLFARVLPELVRNHWPDFQAHERRAGQSEKAPDG